MDASPEVSNGPGGTVQGGAQALLAEIAAGHALAERGPYAAVDLDIRYLNRVRSESVSATAEVLAGGFDEVSVRVPITEVSDDAPHRRAGERRVPPDARGMTRMERRRLGRSGLEVSKLSFGVMTFGSGQPPITTVDERDARNMVSCALDAGVNLLDTADVYGNGTSEEILGRVLGNRRDRVLIATKMGFGSLAEGALSYDNVTAACEASLRRLGTDRIDLYQLHRPDRTTPIEETLRALDDLVTRGLVRETGTSNFRAWEVAGAVARQRALGTRPFTAVQTYYSLVGRDAEHEILPQCRADALGVLVWSPLAGGYLTGRYAPDQDGGRTDGRRTTFSFPPVDTPRADAVVAALRDDRGRARRVRSRRSPFPGCSTGPTSRR